MAKDTDAIIVNTNWDELSHLDLEQIRIGMKTPILFDGRNAYDPSEVRSLGFTYRGIGRGFKGE